MDARIKWLAVVAAAACLGADYSTKNFIVYAPDPQFAKHVAMAAEKYRRELAVEWLGHELPDWSEKCPIRVSIAAQAGGQTSFGFVAESGRSMPIGWEMEVFGSPERILDSVLPHEVTHTIFATHFGRPLPRWADEGACTTVEHISERTKNHELLMRFLTSNRGIPFNKMFAMKQYPNDIYPLYAQGYSVARFLIMQGGKQHFIDFVGAGMSAEQPGNIPRAWDSATNEFYGFEDLSELQVRWIHWVKQGCPDLTRQPAASAIATAAPANTSAVPANAVAQNDRVARDERSMGADSWYVSQATNPQRAFTDELASNQPVGAPEGPNDYRPGSVGSREAIEVLATVSTVNVNANRLHPDSVYYARPEIHRGGEQDSTVWR